MTVEERPWKMYSNPFVLLVHKIWLENKINHGLKLQLVFYFSVYPLLLFAQCIIKKNIQQGAGIIRISQ